MKNKILLEKNLFFNQFMIEAEEDNIIIDKLFYADDKIKSIKKSDQI